MKAIEGITWTRKPNSLSEITTRASLSFLDQVLDGKKIIWMNWSEELANKILREMSLQNMILPQYFGVFVDDRMYFVNTEGYDYCRYVVRITDF